MLNHIPDAIELVDYIDDGEQARHFQFRLLNMKNSINKNSEKNTNTNTNTNTDKHNWQDAQPGQFFMLNVPSIGEAAFTFTQPPNEQGEFRALIRQMGKLTSTLFTLTKGEILGARGPFGRGWPLEKISKQNIIIIAGGCGLAPLVNLIDGLTCNKADNQQIVLVYGAQSKQAQLLTTERERWQQQIKIYNTLDEVNDQYALGENESQGTPVDILDTALASFTKPATTALLCGPEIMMHSAAKQLVNNGIASDAIFLAIERRMHCAVGLCGHCYLNEHYVCKHGPTFSWQELQKIS